MRGGQAVVALPRGEVSLSYVLMVCLGISERDLRVLRELRRGGPMRPEEVGARLGLGRGAAWSSLRRLEGLGLVRKLHEGGLRGRPRTLYAAADGAGARLEELLRLCAESLLEVARVAREVVEK